MPAPATAARWPDRVPGSAGSVAWHLAMAPRGRQQQITWRWLDTGPSPRRIAAVLRALHRYPEDAAARPFLVLAGAGRLSDRALTRTVSAIPHARVWLLRAVLTVPGIDPDVLARIALSYNQDVFAAATHNPGFALDAAGWRRAAVTGRTHAAVEALTRVALDPGALGRVARRGDAASLAQVLLDHHGQSLAAEHFQALLAHREVRVDRAVAGCPYAPADVLAALAGHDDAVVRARVAANPACPVEVAVAAALSC